uniref:Swi5-dependent recombination DNA repair protein 1 homolog n=1 Tax=Phallusia mammillata TaxID=59560 RepID=A0A6F9DSB0_9ASCI|nr:swi5-dependent recombination DNA repair protein 1 homolog [Phallusia mammillata]
MTDDTSGNVLAGDLNDDDDDVSLMISAVVACEENLKAKAENDAVTSEEKQTNNHQNSDAKEAVSNRQCNPVSNSKPDLLNEKSLNDQYDAIEQTVRKNTETLRKLKLVKNHKEKNNIKSLELLIQKWRKASQIALIELLEYAPKEPETTLGQLITYLGIDHETIKFDQQTQSFMTKSQGSL